MKKLLIALALLILSTAPSVAQQVTAVGPYSYCISYTPTVTGAGTPGTPVYSAQNGKYCQSGPISFVAFNVTLSSKGGMVGNILLNLPFTISGTPAASICYGSVQTNLQWTLDAGYTWVVVSGVSNTATARFLEEGSAKAAAVIADTYVTDTAIFNGTLTCYQ